MPGVGARGWAESDFWRGTSQAPEVQEEREFGVKGSPPVCFLLAPSRAADCCLGGRKMNSGRELNPCSPGPGLVGAASPLSPAPSPKCSSAELPGLLQLQLLHW